MFWSGLGSKKKFELYSRRLTTFVLVVLLYLAYLILSHGVGGGRKSDFKVNSKSNLDLDLRFVENKIPLFSSTLKVGEIKFL